MAASEDDAASSPSAKRLRVDEMNGEDAAEATNLNGTPTSTSTPQPHSAGAQSCNCSQEILHRIGEVGAQLREFMERQEAMNASLAEQQSNITEAIIGGFAQQAQLVSLAFANLPPAATANSGGGGGDGADESLATTPAPQPKSSSKREEAKWRQSLGSVATGRCDPAPDPDEVSQAAIDAFVHERAHIGAKIDSETAASMARLGFPLETVVRSYKVGKATRFCILKSYLWQAVKLDCERGNLDYKDIICAAKEGEGMEEYIERQPRVVRRAVRLALTALRHYKNFPPADAYDNSELFAKLMGACRHLREMGRKAENEANRAGGSGDLSSLSMAPPEEAASPYAFPSTPASTAPVASSAIAVDESFVEESPEERSEAFVREKDHIGARLTEKDALEMAALGFSLKAVRNAYKIGKASKFCILKSYLYQLTKPDYEFGRLDYKDIIGSPKEDEGMAEFIERQPELMNRAVQMSFKALQNYPGFPADDQNELFSRLIGALRHCRQNLPRNKVTGPPPSARESPQPRYPKEEVEEAEGSPFTSLFSGFGDEEEERPPSPDSLAREFVTAAPNIGADVPEEDAVEMSKLGFPLKRIILAYKFAKASRFCVLKSMLWQLLKTECEKGILDYRDIIVNPREAEPLESYLHRQPDLVSRAIKVAILALFHYPDFPASNEGELFQRIIHANRYIGKQVLRMGACKVYRPSGGGSSANSSFSSTAPSMVPLQSLSAKLRPDDLLGRLNGVAKEEPMTEADEDSESGSTSGGGDLMERIGREPTPAEKEAAFVKAKAHIGADLSEDEAAAMSRQGFSLKLLSDAYKFAKSSRHCVLKSYLWQIIKHEGGMDYRDVIVTPKEGHGVSAHVQRQPDPVIRATQLAFQAFRRYPDFVDLRKDEEVFSKLIPAYRYVRESARHKSGIAAKSN